MDLAVLWEVVEAGIKNGLNCVLQGVRTCHAARN